jgi:hypothetical protein
MAGNRKGRTTMSRYEIEPDEKHRHCRIACGWDAALGNFFLQVENTRAPETSDKRMVQWLGADGVKTLTNVDTMLLTLNRYGQAPEGLRDKLLRDEAAEPFREGLGHRFLQEMSQRDKSKESRGPVGTSNRQVTRPFEAPRPRRSAKRDIDREP